MSLIRANINPGRLNWTRRAAGLSVAESAQKTGLTQERLSAIEDGEAQPTLRQLRLLAKAYRRPTAFFYGTGTLDPLPGMPDFRMLPDLPAGEGESPALLYELRRARSRRDTALEVLRLIGEEPRTIKLTADREDGVKPIAERIRGFLGVALDKQFSWRDSYAALRGWTSAAESKDILVFQLSGIQVAEVRGYSLSLHPMPVVALNGKDAPHGRVFTLLHEMAHLALNLSGLCDLHNEDGFDWVEPFCNAVAAEALIPEDSLRGHDVVQSHETDEAWEDAELSELSKTYSVSREAALRKLLTHGLTTEEFYRARRKRFREEYRRRKEEQEGFLEYYRRVLRDNGASYTALLLQAYDQRAISARDLSHYLGDIKWQHIGPIRESLPSATD